MADRDIPEEMVEKAAAAFTNAYDRAPRDIRMWTTADLSAILRSALSAALAGRTVVDLPEPDGTRPQSLMPGPIWHMDRWSVSAYFDGIEPRADLSLNGDGFGFTADRAEEVGLRLLAAARAARMLPIDDPRAAGSEAGDADD